MYRYARALQIDLGDDRTQTIFAKTKDIGKSNHSKNNYFTDMLHIARFQKCRNSKSYKC